MLTLSPRRPPPAITRFPATGRPEDCSREESVMNNFPYTGRHPYFDAWIANGVVTADDAEFSYDEWQDFVAEQAMNWPPGREVEIYTTIRRFSIYPRFHRATRSLFAKIGYVWNIHDRKTWVR
jgi:hypothetical protein